MEYDNLKESYQFQSNESPNQVKTQHSSRPKYEGWNFNSGNYLFTTDTK